MKQTTNNQWLNANTDINAGMMLDVVPNPYSDVPAWSVQVPNSVSGMTLKEYMDGSQPHYDNARCLETLLHYVGIFDFDTVADYPKDGNTLRFTFAEEKEAITASTVFKLVYLMIKD